MSDALETELARHCAPALAGIKAGNLLCLSRGKFPRLAQRLDQYRQDFTTRGISFEVLCDCEQRVLLLVYRKELLERHLSQPGAWAILSRAGYPGDVELPGLLEHLKHRLGQGAQFPHEIGLFLEYPPEDVEGFQRNRGYNCKLCGHWKVYANPAEARTRFLRYDRCRDALCRRLEQGMTLRQLFIRAA